VATKLGFLVSRNTKLDEIIFQFREISRNYAKFHETNLDEFREIARNLAKFRPKSFREIS
jgi:hypothetical protein